MSKRNKIILLIIAGFVIILAIGFYAIIPEYRVNDDTSKKIITVQDLVQNTYKDSFKIKTEPLRLAGKLSIDNEEIRDIIYTLKEKYRIAELKDVSITIKDSKINVIIPWQVLSFIDSQYSMDLFPSIVDDNLVITCDNLKLGKIKLPNKMLEPIVNNLKDEVPFTITKNTITVDKSYIRPLKLKNINIEKDKMILYVELHLKNLIDFIKEYNIKVEA